MGHPDPAKRRATIPKAIFGDLKNLGHLNIALHQPRCAKLRALLTATCRATCPVLPKRHLAGGNRKRCHKKQRINAAGPLESSRHHMDVLLCPCAIRHNPAADAYVLVICRSLKRRKTAWGEGYSVKRVLKTHSHAIGNMLHMLLESDLTR